MRLTRTWGEGKVTWLPSLSGRRWPVDVLDAAGVGVVADGEAERRALVGP